MENYLDTPAWKLDERAQLLKGNLDTIYYGEERYNQIKHELGMIALELLSRQLENHGYTPGEAVQGLGVDYFGFNAEPKGKLLGRAVIGLESA